MTEEKKTLSPQAKWLIAYLVYVAVCIAACYGAGAVQQAMRHQIYSTYHQFPYTVVSFAAFIALGVLWAAEGLFAAKVRKIAVLFVRVFTILVLLLLGIGWAFSMGMSGTASALLFRSSMDGITQIFALIVGWLAIDTVVRVFRRA